VRGPAAADVSRMTTATAKDRARRQWNGTPCGSRDLERPAEPETLEWFDELRRVRYQVKNPWIPRLIDLDGGPGLRLLEIGHGIGSDLVTFAERGAICHGLELTEEHHRLCRANFEAHGFTVYTNGLINRPGKYAVLALGDAADLPFPTASFDLVYSNGVLHHTPDTVRCLGEAYRVLRPGGQLILALYHTWSAFHLVEKLLWQGICRGDLKRLGYRALMATLEAGADGWEMCPLVKTYTRRQLRTLLSDFSALEIRGAHLAPGHFGPLRRFVPAGLARRLEPRLGWYLIAFARKPA
jgi:SAM-dependent methyltransferase